LPTDIKHITVRRKAGSALFPCLLLFAAIGLSACENDPEQIAAIVEDAPERPIETAREVRVIYSDSANVKVILDAGLLERYSGDDPRLEMSEGVHVQFLDNRGNVTSELRSRRAVSHEKTDLMEARDDVVVVNERNETLNTEHLIWNKENETITTEEFVKITTEDEIIFGHGLESNQDFTKYRIKNIKGTIDIEDADSTENP
jgi:LPS export ABC transporter protein LptC